MCSEPRGIEALGMHDPLQPELESVPDSKDSPVDCEIGETVSAVA